MKYIKYFFLILVIFFLSCKSGNKKEMFLTENKFELIIWKNDGSLNINKLKYSNLNNLKREYNIFISFKDEGIVSYYWDEQIIKVKISEEELTILKEVMESIVFSKIEEFFSIAIDDKILYSGSIWDGGVSKCIFR